MINLIEKLVKNRSLSIEEYKFLIDNNDVNQFVTSEGLKNFLANNSDFKFTKTENPAIFDVYMPFKSDRPFRNLLEEFISLLSFGRIKTSRIAFCLSFQTHVPKTSA